MKKLTINRETLMSLTESQTTLVGGGMRAEPTHGCTTIAHSHDTDCQNHSVSICLTNCGGCKWTN